MMNLFNPNREENILPLDGEALYFGKIFSQKESNRYREFLLNSIAWKNDEAFIFGKHIITKRKVAWYGDQNFDYEYSNVTRTALLWTKELLELKEKAEYFCKTKYNSCLLNLYHSGEEGMTWHSDNERSLGKNTSIASLSFGAERKFSFKHKKTKQTSSIILEHGSLLEMKGSTQTHWLHRLPPTKKTKEPRVNLTFRTMV